MKTRRTTLPAALIVLAALLSGTCLAKDNSREAALRAAEIARFEANVNADAAALERLLDAGLEYSHSNGKLDGKIERKGGAMDCPHCSRRILKTAVVCPWCSKRLRVGDAFEAT